MKKITTILLIAFLGGCSEAGILKYEQEQDGVYFVKRAVNQKIEYNFAGSDKGDSTRTFTFKVELRVLGRASDKDRHVYFTTHSFNKLDSTEFARFKFPNPFVLRANLLTDTMTVTFIRPEKRQVSYGMTLKIDAANTNSSFTTGILEASNYDFEMKDTFAKPGSWESFSGYYGEYSVEKHAFIVTVTRKIDFWNDWLKGDQNVKLRAALDKYNKAHPDAPKPFTFPVKPSNWDW